MSAPVPIFQEFYCQTTASNLNAGSTTADAALVTYTNSAVLGWSATTGVFEVASGDPVADGVTVGMWASIYVTAGATVATFVAKIVAVSTTAVSVALIGQHGTAPTSDTTGARTMKVGGAWDGPSGTVGFPFGFATCLTADWSAARAYIVGDVVGNTGVSGGKFRCILGHTNQAPPNATYWVLETAGSPRVNIKNGVTYAITAGMTHGVTTPAIGACIFSGYTATPGDGGIAIFDGGAPATAYTMLTVSVARIVIENIQVQNNGSGSPGGSAGDGIRITAGGTMVRKCIAKTMRHNGIYLGANSQAVECEAAECNTRNTTSGGSFGGIVLSSGGARAVRCISHDHTAGTNAHGIVVTSAGIVDGCILANISGDGIYNTTSGVSGVTSCDFYNCRNNINFASGPANPTVASIENCNFLKGSGYGIVWRANTIGTLLNCAFGRGTMVNASGDMSVTQPCGIIEKSTKYLTADTTPWVDPTTGDFRISSSQVVARGRGRFLMTKSGYTGTVGYPDIGAAQKQPS